MLIDSSLQVVPGSVASWSRTEMATPAVASRTVSDGSRTHVASDSVVWMGGGSRAAGLLGSELDLADFIVAPGAEQLQEVQRDQAAWRFNPDALIDSSFDGADTRQLHDAMRGLSRHLDANPAQIRVADRLSPAVDGFLTEIAAARGLTLDAVRADYSQFLQVLTDSQSGAVPQPLGSFHDAFYGSTQQLRYGSVVGDSLGLDPVFGALLNPTGGMTGPGQWALPISDSGGSALGRVLAYHAASHDAAGYLATEHDVGPGYRYAPENFDRALDLLGFPVRPLVDRLLPADSGLSGQDSGIAFWAVKLATHDLQHAVDLDPRDGDLRVGPLKLDW